MTTLECTVNNSPTKVLREPQLEPKCCSVSDPLCLMMTLTVPLLVMHSAVLGTKELFSILHTTGAVTACMSDICVTYAACQQFVASKTCAGHTELVCMAHRVSVRGQRVEGRFLSVLVRARRTALQVSSTMSVLHDIDIFMCNAVQLKVGGQSSMLMLGFAACCRVTTNQHAHGDNAKQAKDLSHRMYTARCHNSASTISSLIQSFRLETQLSSPHVLGQIAQQCH